MPTLSFRKLHPHFAAEASAIELRTVTDQPRLDAIRAGMDEYAVLVFRDQPFADTEQLEFAQRFDGVLHAKTGASVVKKNRFGCCLCGQLRPAGFRAGLALGNIRPRRCFGQRLCVWCSDFAAVGTQRSEYLYALDAATGVVDPEQCPW